MSHEDGAGNSWNPRRHAAQGDGILRIAGGHGGGRRPLRCTVVAVHPSGSISREAREWQTALVCDANRPRPVLQGCMRAGGSDHRWRRAGRGQGPVCATAATMVACHLCLGVRWVPRKRFTRLRPSCGSIMKDGPAVTLRCHVADAHEQPFLPI